MDLKHQCNHQFNSIMSLRKLYSLATSHTNKKVTLSHSYRVYFVRYTWSKSDERIFFLDKYLLPIEDDINTGMFPGLQGFLRNCKESKEEVLSQVKERDIPDLLSVDEPRGPQSFAFGHYVVDILPTLFYLQLFEESRLSLLPPLLTYGMNKWQEDLHRLFCISKTRVLPLDSQKSILGRVTNRGQQIRLYAANIQFISSNNTLLRKCFANSLRVINYQDEAVEKTDILFLTRKELGGRPIRWTNQDMFESILKSNKEVNSLIVDPARVMPSRLVLYTKQSSVIISPPGSSAYIPLHVSRSGVFVVMPVSFDCGHEDTWAYTLDMFSQYSNKLILISNTNCNIFPSSAAWDHPFKINQIDLMNFITRIISITESRDFEDLSNQQDRHQAKPENSRHVVRFQSLTASLPSSFRSTITRQAS